MTLFALDFVGDKVPAADKGLVETALADLGRGAGEPTFDNLVKHDWCGLSDFKKNSCVDVHTDEHHPRIVSCAVSWIASVERPRHTVCLSMRHAQRT